MEIADAVLTLRTDDAPLRAGLDQAEQRIRDSLSRMEHAVAQVATGLDAEGSAAIAAAVNALAVMGAAVTGTSTAATAATARLAFLTTATQTLGGTSLLAAQMVTNALVQIQSTMAALAAASAALAQSEADRRAAEEEDAAPPPPPPPPPGEVLPGLPISARRLAPAGPTIGTLHVTVERENPRAIQAGVERALVELAHAADLAGALD